MRGPERPDFHKTPAATATNHVKHLAITV
jgi:hypothetical protein